MVVQACSDFAADEFFFPSEQNPVIRSGIIINLLSWRFLKAVLLANVLALPIAWLYLRDWLKALVYRIELGPEHLLIPAVVTLLIAWATVATQAWTVARSRPINSLRYE